MFSGSVFSTVIWVIAILACALVSAAIAQRYGRNFWTWFVSGVVFGPLTLVYLLVSGRPKRERPSR